MNKGTLGYPGRWWESPVQLIASVNQTYVFNHGMGELPFLVTAVMVNLISQGGWLPGQEISVSDFGATGDSRCWTVGRDRGRIFVMHAGSFAPVFVPNPAAAITTITLGSTWGVKVYALFP